VFTDPALQRLEDTILSGGLYDASANVIGLAKGIGFEIYNVKMDNADGFILVREGKGNSKIKSRRIIGVNSKNSLKRKRAFIAQELNRYYLAKLNNDEKDLELSQRDTLVLNKNDFDDNVYCLVKDKGNKDLRCLSEKERREVLEDKDIRGRLIENYRIFFTNLLSIVRADKARQIESMAINELLQYQIVKVENDVELKKDQFQSDIERKRDEQVTSLFERYVDLYTVRENKRIKYREWLFAFCILMAVSIIGISLWMLVKWLPIIAGQYKTTPTQLAAVTDVTPAPSTDGFRLERLLFSVAEASDDLDEVSTSSTVSSSADSENEDINDIKDYIDNALASDASTATKDIVAIVSICVTILSSIFVLLRMIAKYVLPIDEEKNMQEIVKMIQKNDFKHEIVVRLYDKKMYKDLVNYLNMADTTEITNGANKIQQNQKIPSSNDNQTT
jgi:hypothetical protein